MSSEKVALLGGSFDPPHNGHIGLVLSLIEEQRFSKVVIIPTGQSPLKQHFSGASDRVRMSLLAFSSFQTVSLCEHEISREGDGNRYTIDTVLHLRSSQFRSEDLVFVMGSDCLSSLDRWKRPEELFQQVKPCVVLRDDREDGVCEVIERLPFSSTLKQQLRSGITGGLIQSGMSSTEVRRRVQDGLWISHMVPPAIEAYIHMYGLYSS